MTLIHKKCVPCEGGVKPLSKELATQLLKQLHGWTMSDDIKKITKTFSFKNYYKTMAFVNAVAWIAHSEDHHPDLSVHYNQCIVTYATHAIDGLSENDFICAAKVDALM